MPSSSVVRLWLISHRQLQRSDYKAGLFSGNHTAALVFLMLLPNIFHVSLQSSHTELVELAAGLIQKR
jgi:hypothetical protein